MGGPGAGGHVHGGGVIVSAPMLIKSKWIGAMKDGTSGPDWVAICARWWAMAMTMMVIAAPVIMVGCCWRALLLRMMALVMTIMECGDGGVEERHAVGKAQITATL